MILEPTDWNVVVIGRWNPAILTPGRIAENIYKWPIEQKTLPVLVPLDGLSPYQVEHPEKQILTLLDANRLIIKTINPTYEVLASAMEAGRSALKWLPETPFTAAGFNIKFHSENAPTELLDFVANETLDDTLSELGYDITSSHVKRALQYKTGLLNLAINRTTDVFSVEYNFHKQSTDTNVLYDWLNISIEELHDAVTKLQEKFELPKEKQA